MIKRYAFLLALVLGVQLIADSAAGNLPWWVGMIGAGLLGFYASTVMTRMEDR